MISKSFPDVRIRGFDAQRHTGIPVLEGSIPESLSSLTALKDLGLGNNQLSGSIPGSLSSLIELESLRLENNQLSGQVPSSFTNLRNLGRLGLSGNEIDHLPPELEPKLDNARRFWSEVVRRKRNRRGGQERSLLRQGINVFFKLWHAIIPIIDDVTDYILLWDTFGRGHVVLWWICFFALALADVGRAYALLYLMLTVITAILVVAVAILGLIVECFTGYSTIGLNLWRPVEIFSGNTFHGGFECTGFLAVFFDAFTWTVFGPRSRYSHEDFGGDSPADVARESGLDVNFIDKFLERHPYTWCGQLLFWYPRGLRVPDTERERSRRALVMLKAVGETVVVDTLFLALGLVSSDSLKDLSSLALWSSVFSILELVTELQHYVNEAEPYLVEDNRATGGCLQGLRVGCTRVLLGSERSDRDDIDATIQV